MSKATQYVIDNTKLCTGFFEASLKGAQASLLTRFQTFLQIQM
jgi:hypothetical protein